MSHSWKVSRQCLLVVVVCVALGACALSGSPHRSSNLLSYLYPNQQQPVAKIAADGMVLPVRVPVRVGVAYVPEQGLSHQALTEADKRGFKTEIAAYFEQQPFVSEVTLVPSAYLTPGGSFGNLDQLSRMYDIDMMVLLSYDRTQFAEARPGVISYWTLGGAQLINGEKNDTHTLLDAAVYDISTRQLLFRAPGSSLIRYQRGALSLAEQLRQDSLAGFEQASAELLTHLRQQLAMFADGPQSSAGEPATTGTTPLIFLDTLPTQ